MSSGRFVLRMPPALHAHLRGRARERGVSLNAYCVAMLEGGGAGALSAPVRDCLEGFGDAVEGVVLFGSVARGSATDASDADLLIVLRPGTPVTRDLYSRWDELGASRSEIEGHPVSPHFAVRPSAGAIAGGLWYEVARDGIVLWERGTTVRAALARLRQQVLNGDVEERRRGGSRTGCTGGARVHDSGLVQDDLTRARHRLAAIDLLHDRGAYADVVRLCQETVELALKALVRSAGIEPPRMHDVSRILVDEAARFPQEVGPDLPQFAKISHSMRRDRELAFYGTEDLTPSDFYRREHAEAARSSAAWVVERVEHAVPSERGVESQETGGGWRKAPEQGRQRGPGASRKRGPGC